MSQHARFFFGVPIFLVSVAALAAALVPGRAYVVKLADVDGRSVSTADGRITVLVLTTSGDTAKARNVGDRVPDFCLANPNYRMITVLNLTGKYPGLARAMATWLIRQGLNAEARRLQKRYDGRKIQREARLDVFAVADFDGSIVSQLGVRAAASEFRVFVFGRDGQLLRQWNDVPSASELAEALKP